MSGNDQPRPDRLSGAVLGQYEIDGIVGQGGMASVYVARQKSMDRTVAIKFLPTSFLHDPTFLERFDREVKTIARLQHPRILPVYDYGQFEGQPYIVMAYMPGGTLSDRIRQGPMQITEVIRFVEQIGEGLDHAHHEGVIHRDFKPSNVLLDKRGNAHLADFGIAKIGETSVGLTGSGVIGTPAYMAPETANAGNVGPAVDIYALGAAIYEMFTGTFPFPGDTPLRVMMAHLTEPPPDVRLIRPDLPEAVSVVIQRAMAKDPAMRYPSGRALADALKQAAAGRLSFDDEQFATLSMQAITRKASGPQPTMQSTLVEQAPTRPAVSPSSFASDTPVAPPTPVSAPDRRRKRAPVLEILIIMIVLALLGGSYYFFQQSSAEQVRATQAALIFEGYQTATARGASQPDPGLTATADAAATAAMGTIPDEDAATAAAAEQQTAQAEQEAAAAQTLTAEAQVAQTATADAISSAGAAATAQANAGRVQEAIAAVKSNYDQESVSALMRTMQSIPPDISENISLAHSLNGQIESQETTENDLHNFVAIADFTNPFPLVLGFWDLGLLFRSTDPLTQFRIYVDAGGSWFFERYWGGAYTFVTGGTIEVFNTADNGINTIALAVIDDSGYLMINGQFVERVFVLGAAPSGKVGVGIGFSDGKERADRTTPVVLNVWRLP